MEAIKRTAPKHVHMQGSNNHQLMKSYRSVIALDICAIVIRAMEYGKNCTHTYGHAQAQGCSQSATKRLTEPTVQHVNGGEDILIA